MALPEKSMRTVVSASASEIRRPLPLYVRTVRSVFRAASRQDKKRRRAPRRSNRGDAPAGRTAPCHAPFPTGPESGFETKYVRSVSEQGRIRSFDKKQRPRQAGVF